jgi:hypothetical protein
VVGIEGGKRYGCRVLHREKHLGVSWSFLYLVVIATADRRLLALVGQARSDMLDLSTCQRVQGVQASFVSRRTEIVLEPTRDMCQDGDGVANTLSGLKLGTLFYGDEQLLLR